MRYPEMRNSCVAPSILDEVLGQAELPTTALSQKARGLLLMGRITEKRLKRLIAC
jgi:hypothetical protein